MGLLLEVGQIELVDDAAELVCDLRVLLPHVEPVADRDQADAPELKQAQQRVEVLVVARQARRVIHQHCVELLVLRRPLQRLQSRPRPNRAGLRFVEVDMLFEDRDPVTFRELPAHPDLILDALLPLVLAREPRIHRRPHRTPPSWRARTPPPRALPDDPQTRSSPPKAPARLPLRSESSLQPPLSNNRRRLSLYQASFQYFSRDLAEVNLQSGFEMLRQ